MLKRKIKQSKIILAAMAVLLLIACAKDNVAVAYEAKAAIAYEAKEVEKNNREIIYSYDRLNEIADHSNPVDLVTEIVSPSSVAAVSEDELFVRFDHTYFGTLMIEFGNPLEKDIPLTIVLSETDADGHAWTRQDANSRLQGFGIDFGSYEVMVPKGTATYQLVLPDRPLPANTPFEGGVKPFCYATVRGVKALGETELSFKQIAVHTEFNDKAGSFESNDELLNEIYSFCRNTVKATTYTGLYVDGYRELRPYEADAYINELSHFSADNNYSVAKATIDYLLRKHTWPTEWILQTVPLVYEYYMYSGDKSFLQEHYQDLQKCLMGELKTSDGLLDSTTAASEYYDSFGVSAINDIIDWPESERDGFAGTNKRGLEDVLKEYRYRYKSFIAQIAGCQYASAFYRITADGMKYANAVVASPNAVVNAFYYNDLVLMSILARELGLSDVEAQYADEAEKFMETYQACFIDSKTGLVKDSKNTSHASLHANMFALNFGLVPEQNVTEVVDFLKSKGMACSVYGSQFLLEALIKNGEEDYALGLIISHDKKSWYNMIYRTGSKLTTEAWDEDIKPNMDWNHAWATAPLNVVTRYMIGVRPYEAGCEAMLFEPRFGNLSSVKAKVPIKDGCVDIEYTSSDGEVKIGMNTTSRVRFKVPASAEDGSLRIDGERNGNAEIWLDAGLHEITYINAD